RFEPISLRRRIFRPLHGGEGYDGPLRMPDERRSDDHRSAAVAAALQTRAFELADIAQIVLDPNRQLVVANRRARDLFAIGDRDTAKPIQDFEVSYRPIELRSRIEEAESEKRPVLVPEVPWDRDGS